MDCPACGKKLAERIQSDLTVEICDSGCGGVWFDNFELEKVDEAHESAGGGLLEIGSHAPVAVDHTVRRRCPKCADQGMQRNFFSVRQEVEIDECPTCGGVWLDTGELAAIRALFKTEAERKQAADKYFKDLFVKELAEERAKGQKELQRARKFAHALRFICPSYYIPGKQPGAAF